MGDLLNKDMLESLFQIKVQRVNYNESNLIAIGSSLSHALYSSQLKVRMKQRIIRILKNDPFYIWGTGFISYNAHEDNKFRFRNIRVLSLRGNLFKNRVERIFGKKLSIPTGDGGLFHGK